MRSAIQLRGGPGRRDGGDRRQEGDEEALAQQQQEGERGADADGEPDVVVGRLADLRAQPVRLDRREGEQRIGDHGARQRVGADQHDQPGGAAELRQAGDLDQHRERQRQHAERAVAAVAHDLQPPRRLQRMRAQPVGGVGQAVLVQGARDHDRRADCQHAGQPARTGEAAHDGEHQAGGEPDAGADEGQHRQHVGQLPARHADIELEPGEERGLLLEGLQPVVERGRAAAGWSPAGGSSGLVMMGDWS